MDVHKNRRWISPREAAEYLGCHIQTCYSWIYEGRIPAARIGRSVRVDLRALEAQLEQQITNRPVTTRTKDKAR